MSALWQLEEQNGKLWFAGWALPMMTHVEPACLIIPTGQIEGLSDKQIGRMVRKSIRMVQFGSAEIEAEHILSSHEKRPKDRLSQSALLAKPQLLLFAGESDLIDEALRVIAEDEQWESRRAKPAMERPPRDRSGYIYLVEGPNCYKIGKSVDVPSRTRSFGLQLPFPTQLIHSMPTTDMVWAEAYMHRTFAHCRMNGEWFDLSPDDVAWICDIERLDPE